MNTGIFIGIDILLLLLLGIIIHNVRQKKNLELSVHLNMVLFMMIFIELLFFTYMFLHDVPLCAVSRNLFC